MKKIPLTKGKYAIVDNEDYPYLNRFKWYFSGDQKFAVRHIQRHKKRDGLSMQSLLVENKAGSLIMHRNNNPLDNRKANLVCVPEKIIIHHRPKNKTGKTSKYKGVHWDKENKLWRAIIKRDLKQYHLGRFKSEKKAAIAYNKKARELYGEFAYQNKI